MTDEREIGELIVSGAIDVSQLACAELSLPSNLLITATSGLLKAWQQRKIREARDIFISELAKGNCDLLNLANPDEFIPIWYRYIRASIEGRAHMNIRLMAKVMYGHAINPSLFASDFLEYADLISNLRRDEIVFLATMLRLTMSGFLLRKENDPEQFYDIDQSVEIELKRQLPKTTFFPDAQSVNSCELGISRTGLLRHVTTLSSGGVIYAPSRLLFKLADLADFQDVLREEGISFSDCRE